MPRNSSKQNVIPNKDARGYATTNSYDSADELIGMVDALGNTTSYVYDALGRLTQTTYADNTTETSAYDAAGNRTNSTDRLGRVATYQYDALNRLTNTIYPDLSTSGTVYDGVGRVTNTIDGRGFITAYGYDVAGRRLASTNAYGTSAAMTNLYAYDANGNQTDSTDSLGRTTTNVFDALNRQVQTLYPDGTQTGMAYDGDGRKIAQTNQDSIITRFGYDGADRLTSVTNALTNVTRYQYDEAGNQTNQIDALNRTNAYTYDGMGRRVKHTMPGGQWEGMGYDLAGNLLYQTNFNGLVLTNQYDSMNRLLSRTAPGGYQLGYTYTLTGQRQTMTDLSGKTTYTYDNRDRLTEKVNNFITGVGLSLDYSYDANGNLTALWSGTIGGVTNTYQYDPLNRLMTMQADGSFAASYAFDPVGNLQAGQFGNGVTNWYQYDRLNRLTNSVWNFGAVQRASFTYQLGLTGNRTNLVESITNSASRSYTWKYDKLYRLTNESMTSFGDTSYGLDAVGNRLGMTNGASITNSTYNTNDWLTTDAYDNNGNTLASTNGTTTTGPFSYDAENHLTNYKGTVSILYNGDGVRMMKTIGGVNTYYLVDDRNLTGYPQVVEEWNGADQFASVTRVYNYGLSLVSQRDIASATVHYYGTDGHGSVRFLTDTNGTVTETYQYDAYGNLINSNGTTINLYLYCSEQWDPDLGTGMYYLRARYYQPITGRFWTGDTDQGSQEDPLSLHKYLYCEGNPVDGGDPSGNDDLDSMIDLSSLALSSAIFDITASASTEGGSVLIGGFHSFAVDVYVWDHNISGYGSVGHVMATKHASRIVLISQFPFKDKAFREEGTFKFPATGYNHPASFADTFKYEQRPPDHIYVVLVPNLSGFTSVANQQKAATYWNWSPTGPNETECSTAVFLSLRAGDVPFPYDAIYAGGPLIPNAFDEWMQEDANRSTTTGVYLLH